MFNFSSIRLRSDHERWISSAAHSLFLGAGGAPVRRDSCASSCANPEATAAPGCSPAHSLALPAVASHAQQSICSGAGAESSRGRLRSIAACALDLISPYNYPAQLRANARSCWLTRARSRIRGILELVIEQVSMNQSAFGIESNLYDDAFFDIMRENNESKRRR